VLRRLYDAIAQAVGDNAQARVSGRSLLNLLFGFLAYAKPGNWATYIKQAMTSVGHPWRKAMFLDLLLADVFVREVRRTRPHFATLFVNAAAHIQHHYLFSSAVYEGESRNPAWYVGPGEDPVLEVYELYDRMVAGILRGFPEARIMIGTGLHQNAHAAVTYYWRLKDHDQFLRTIGLEFIQVEPLMSRDFLVRTASVQAAEQAGRVLQSARAADGTPLFEIDNRGSDLFVMLVYPHDVAPGAGFLIGDRRFEDLRSQVAFVALKNGEHDGIGYFVDTGRRLDPKASPLPLTSIPEMVFEALLGPAASRG
jgi:hypothetical protein